MISDNKKSLIKCIEVDLTHENKEVQKFKWKTMSEYISEVDMPNTGVMPTRKFEKAIAINLKKETLIKKRVMFEQPKYKDQFRALNDEIQEIIDLKGADILETENCYIKTLSLIDNSFFWKMGNYKAVFKVFELSQKQTFNIECTFSINDRNLKYMKESVDLSKKYLISNIVRNEDTKIIWRWLNLKIKQISL